MKIGILTHHYVSNYGAFLQAYALQTAVSKEFPADTVEIIDYINIKHFIINFCGWFRFYAGRENLRSWWQKIKVPFTFAFARKQELQLSPRCYTAQQINRQNYDVIIVGSDEVWNYRDKKSKEGIKFGHKISCKNLIAYAPSVGDASGDGPEYVCAGIKKFKHISARDDMTADLVLNTLGRKPVRVADPTCLTVLPSMQMKSIRKPYILFYYCDHLPETVKIRILADARANGMAVYGAGECSVGYDAVTVNLHPFEWVSLFQNAEYVFTGTFHGVMLSVLNRRQFWVHVTNKSRIQKVESVLKEFAIENREMNVDFQMDTAEKIDYTAVDGILNERRGESLRFLQNAMEEIRLSARE